jgi:acid phosphatase class B
MRRILLAVAIALVAAIGISIAALGASSPSTLEAAKHAKVEADASVKSAEAALAAARASDPPPLRS